MSPTQTSPDWLEQLPEKYHKLREYLAEGQMQYADQETGRLMCEVTERSEERWLDIEHVQNFPCEDLQIIDQLWIHFSKGKFGFSVQKKIYLEVGGKDSEYSDEAIWEKFGDRVGWRANSKWISYEDILLQDFDDSIPEGNLPVTRGGWWWWWRRQGLYSRVETCQL